MPSRLVGGVEREREYSDPFSGSLVRWCVYVMCVWGEKGGESGQGQLLSLQPITISPGTPF